MSIQLFDPMGFLRGYYAVHQYQLDNLGTHCWHRSYPNGHDYEGAERWSSEDGDQVFHNGVWVSK